MVNDKQDNCQYFIMRQVKALTSTDKDLLNIKQGKINSKQDSISEYNKKE